MDDKIIIFHPRFSLTKTWETIVPIRLREGDFAKATQRAHCRVLSNSWPSTDALGFFFFLIPEYRHGYFWCAPHLLPPGALHCECVFPLWLPSDLLSAQQCESWGALVGRNTPQEDGRLTGSLWILFLRKRRKWENVDRSQCLPLTCLHCWGILVYSLLLSLSWVIYKTKKCSCLSVLVAGVATRLCP